MSIRLKQLSYECENLIFFPPGRCPSNWNHWKQWGVMVHLVTMYFSQLHSNMNIYYSIQRLLRNRIIPIHGYPELISKPSIFPLFTFVDNLLFKQNATTFIANYSKIWQNITNYLRKYWITIIPRHLSLHKMLFWSAVKKKCQYCSINWYQTWS